MEENNYGGFDYDFHETLNQGLKYGEDLKYRDKQQQHEYGQQVALQLQSQEFAMDYEGKMNAMMKAGINPLTAAAGLAGASTSAISSVPSTGVGQGVNAVNAASEAVKTLSGGAKDVVESVAQGTKLDPEKNQIIADTYLKYKEAGYNDEMAKGLAIANSYMPAEKFLGLVSLSGQIRNLHGEYLNMMKDIDVKNERIKEIEKHIKEMGSTISLNEKLALESEKRALQIEAQTEETQWLNNKRNELDIDPRSPLEMNMFMSGVKYGPDDARYTTGNQILFDTNYNRFSGQYSAEDKYAYSIAYRRQRGENVADIVDNRIGGWPDLIGRVSEHVDIHIGNIVNGIKNVPKNQQGKKIREELTMVLNNAYKSQEDFPDDKDIPRIIEDLQLALSLSNNELVEWYSKNWK